ncbi:uncharacterized protein LOC8266787 isoform X2 [Ricinus communis]|uniref:uncharacterized protein LOC8266787 isoform X2 n=1 Tax=Ricinus communis TaxID=3988 RepID=UPI00201A4625|nr:uncharacterized protein LOC8266787 isoform X2 [Ricinus communis]
MEEPSSASDDEQVLMEDDEGIGLERNKVTKFVVKASHEAKLKELLHKINSIEIKLCSDATKEFIKLLKGSSGGELLHLYVHSTSDFSELFAALKLREGKSGTHYIFKLISVILGHPEGKFIPNDKGRIGISVGLDKFARSFLEEKLDFVYKDLVSKDKKRQNAALSVMDSVVRRGSGLASEVAKKFDFKLKGFSKLSEYKPLKNENKRRRSTDDEKRKYITRKAFIAFAMSFLEVGKPGLLRWVLQQREVYSDILRGLGEDDDETVMYVLSILRDRVLTEESLLPPALRSVLFGSVVLEQLADISEKRYGGPTANLAHNVLLMVCTDPCNGLMPDLKRRPNALKGNSKRLLQLMKKLKAKEVFHRELLLAIVRGRPSLGSAYLEEFPYNLEDFASPNWCSTVSLAAHLVSLVNLGIPFDFLDSRSDDPPSFDNVAVQNIMKIIASRPVSRSVINKGLLHSDFLVKNGTLRLLLETLRLFDSFFRAINLSCNEKQMMQKCAALKQEIRNEIQTLLPDPQVFLTLLSPLSSHARTNESSLKRATDKENFLVCGKRRKKLKRNIKNGDNDIIIGGLSSAPDNALPEDGEDIVDSEIAHASDSEMDHMSAISELWGLDQSCVSVSTLKDAEIFFHSKLFDALKLYVLIIPTAFEGSFDFFMNLLSNPSELPSNLLSSLLSLLVEYIRWSPGSGIAIRTPQMMYKHLQPFLNLLLFSPVDIKDQSYNLARAAMSSTGAFDRNLDEIILWFLFLPGFSTVKSSVEIHGEMVQSMARVLISFLCDAISTVGNNLFRYWHAVRNHIRHSKEFTDISPKFSPLIICVLQKCMRLLSSESGTFSIPEKSMISAYVCNTLKYLLQTQVDARLLAALIRSVLSEGLEDHVSVDSLCEWQPLKNLLLMAESLLNQKTCCLFLTDQKDLPIDISFTKALGEIRKIIKSENDGGEIAGITKAFCSAIICTTSDVVLKNFPAVMTISQQIRVPLSCLSSIVFQHQSSLSGASKLWPQVFFPGLEKACSMINPQGMGNDAVAQEIMLNMDFDASEATAAAAFGLFLRQAPFHVLFPTIISSNGTCLLEPSKTKDLLMAKLSECKSDFVVSYLRLLLFWFYQIQVSYRIKPLVKLEDFAEICYILVKHMLDQLLVLKADSGNPLSAELIREAAESIFYHPAVKAALTHPLGCDDNAINDDFAEGNFRGNLEAFYNSSQQKVHPIDHHVFNMLITTFEYFLSPSGGQHHVLKVDDGESKLLVKAFKTLMQSLYLELKDKFDLCIRTEDLLPLLQPFYALHALMQFASPFELFGLARWILDRVEVNDLAVLNSFTTFALSIGFCIAADAFKILSIYLQQPVRTKTTFYSFGQMEEKSLDVDLIEEVYVRICKFATNFGLDFAYTCLVGAVSAVYRQKCIKPDVLDPLSLVISRIIMGTPVEVVSQCIYGTSKIKAKLLVLLVEMSPQHLSVFGYLFLGILNKNVHIKGKMAEEACKMSVSDEDFMLLLPAAFSYLNSVVMKLGMQKYHKQFTDITSFYSEILLRGFCNWNNFVSGNLFQENFDEFLSSSLEELLNLVDASLLGTAMHMLRCHFALSGEMKMKEQMKFHSIPVSCTAHEELLDCEVDEIEFYSRNQLLNLINRVTAKIVFCRMLLFDHACFLPKEADDSNLVSTKRLQFIQTLVKTWHCMVKKFPSFSDSSSKEKRSGCLQLYRYLELLILNTILELTKEMHDDLIQLQAVPFLEQLMRSSLLYRFEDPTTLNILRSILTLLSQGEFSSVMYLQLLLAHSQFASTIHSVTELHGSQTGALFRPMPSILRSLVSPHPNYDNDLQRIDLHLKQLEIIKLLRTLIQLKPDPVCCYSGQDMGINLKELYFLLLSSYGATLGDIDVEIFSLMREIESIDTSVSEDLAKLDYLWGTAALRIRKERALDWDTSSSVITNKEVFEEHRRSQFREVLPINPNICATTVNYFPYDRIMSIELENPKNMRVAHFPGERYDPIFILNFSNHNLSMGHIEPLEFACLGLLAISFISMSSPDIEIRKLSDASLGKFKDALERFQKKKDVLRLHLLLTYIQNGIKERLQRIPSIIALFAAESSFILLDPSNDHFTTLNKHLMHSSAVDMKHIPLFHTFFHSNSVNFRAERLWMLRLVCAGLNLDDDAQIYISNSILETLLSFYTTPLADNESKELILQVVKKSVKLDRMTRHLVESCGLFPWLSTVLSISSAMLDENKDSFSSLQLVLAIEGREKLSVFLMWAVSTALKSDCENNFHFKESHASLIIVSEEKPSESLISKLLRWLVAAVILGKLSWKLNDVNTKFSKRSSPVTLQSFLEYVEKGCRGSKNYEFDCEEVLAATIFYLQQIIGLNWRMPSSAVSTLCILVLCGPPKCLDFRHGYCTDVVYLCSKVRCPTEANPDWKWSFDKPWEDPKLEISDLQKMDEYHACQTLMVIISSVLGKKPLDSQVLSHQNLVNSEVFEWERRIIETNDN